MSCSNSSWTAVGSDCVAIVESHMGICVADNALLSLRGRSEGRLCCRVSLQIRLTAQDPVMWLRLMYQILVGTSGASHWDSGGLWQECCPEFQLCWVTLRISFLLSCPSMLMLLIQGIPFKYTWVQGRVSVCIMYVHSYHMETLLPGIVKNDCVTMILRPFWFVVPTIFTY